MATWCDRCGRALADADHAGCAAARALEPPRFCPHCRRRMKVQVLPSGWSASCAVHGATGPDATGPDATGPAQPRSVTGR